MSAPVDAHHYALVCTACGRRHRESDDGLLLGCDAGHGPAMLRAEYAAARLVVDERAPGLYRWRSWLPVRRVLGEAGRPVVFRSAGLAARLGMDDLWLAFSGYWPERGAAMETGSFKELEATSVLARIPGGFDRFLVVASAGNTARAFLQAGSRCGARVVAVVPRSALPMLWLTVERGHRALLVAVEGDYADAIELAGKIAARPDCAPEGGARNVARRDGMGTVLLAAAEAMGAIPRHYVQAVGSGTGAIAAWEAAARLRRDGRFGTDPMALHLVQAEPFTPLRDAWRARSRELPLPAVDEARRRAGEVHAPVLANRAPPWGIAGGLFDAMSACGGSLEAVATSEARGAGALFEQGEGCDLDPAAEVAVAGLERALASGSVARGDRVLLNLTGGGVRRLAATGRIRPLKPDLVVDRGTDASAAVGRLLEERT
jgi:cysteate synthase